MAQSSSRRSGHSRRAQFSLFTGYLAAIFGALIGLALLGLSIWQPQWASDIRGAASDVTEPAGTTTAVARTERQGFLESIEGYLEAGSQNARLKQELELTEIKLAESEALNLENARLRALLELPQVDEAPVATARLVGSSSTSSRRYAYIGAGSKDGVQTGMPVRSSRGVVGRILETGRSTSRVLLLTDSQSILPVRRAKDDVVALAQGRGDGLLNIRLLNLGLNPLEVGDMFVTSGTGGYYRPGVAVGIVSEITDEGALARLVADPASADYVSIGQIWVPEVVEAAQTPDEEPFGDASEAQRQGGDAQMVAPPTPAPASQPEPSATRAAPSPTPRVPNPQVSQ
jgi:rod shape-determining protein MreC